MPLPITRLKKLAVALPLAFALLFSAGLATAQGSVVAAGSAVRDDNDTIWKRFVELAGGPGARVAVFSAPSGDPERAAAAISASLTRRGAVAEHIRIGPRISGQDQSSAVRDPAWIAKLDAASGVYFSGGDQRLLLDLLMPGGVDTPLMQAVRRVFARGGVVGGESAGCAVMSDPAFRDLPSPLLALKASAAELLAGGAVGRGFGFLPPGLMVDQHFLARGRIGRLIPAMLALKQPLGLGVEEGSAAVVRGDTLEVLGVKGVVVVNMAGAQSDAALGAFNVRGVKLSYLDKGDNYNLKTGLITPAPGKRSREVLPNVVGFSGRFERAPFAADILAREQLLTTMALLVDGNQRSALGLAFAATQMPGDKAPELGFEWHFSVAAETRGWSSPASGGDYTLDSVGLEIRPVTMAWPLYGPWRASPALPAIAGTGAAAVAPAPPLKP